MNEALNPMSCRRTNYGCKAAAGGQEEDFGGRLIEHSDHQLDRATHANYNAREQANMYERSFYGSELQMLFSRRLVGLDLWPEQYQIVH